MKKSNQELDATTHDQILQDGQRRFPVESYHQLRAAGAGKLEALVMLGFEEEEMPPELRG